MTAQEKRGRQDSGGISDPARCYRFVSLPRLLRRPRIRDGLNHSCFGMLYGFLDGDEPPRIGVAPNLSSFRTSHDSSFSVCLRLSCVPA
jgi:hypothetical protein